MPIPSPDHRLPDVTSGFGPSDGRRIAAITVTVHGDFAICIIDVTTAAVTVLTEGEADAFYPA